MSLQTTADKERRKVGIAEAKIATNGELLTTSGIGSCLGIAIYDDRNEIGGLVHIMLPEADESVEIDSKYADTGIESLVRDIEESGADRSNLRAKVAGGSDMLSFESNTESIGSRNIEAVREKLDELGIPLSGEDVGGDHGRSLEFDPATGSLRVTSAKQQNHLL